MECKKYTLLAHPGVEEITRQLTVDFEADEDRYGEYIGMLRESVFAEIDPAGAVEYIKIAPEKIERGTSVAAFVLTGTTDTHQKAVVEVSPLDSAHSLGEIRIYESEEQSAA